MKFEIGFFIWIISVVSVGSDFAGKNLYPKRVRRAVQGTETNFLGEF